MAAQPTVFVVDDDEALRDSLRSLLESVALPVETFASAQEFLQVHDPARPGCLVLDVSLPGMSGLELQERLGSNGDQLPIIVLTAHADVPVAVRAMKAGAVDFLTKPCSSQDLLERIQRALETDTQNRRQRAWIGELSSRFDQLTPREHQVMLLVVAGKSNKTIAAELGVSTKTVEAHRTRIMEKTQAASVADLVRMAMACRVVTMAPPADEGQAPPPE